MWIWLSTAGYLWSVANNSRFEYGQIKWRQDASRTVILFHPTSIIYKLFIQYSTNAIAVDNVVKYVTKKKGNGLSKTDTLQLFAHNF